MFLFGLLQQPLLHCRSRREPCPAIRWAGFMEATSMHPIISLARIMGSTVLLHTTNSFEIITGSFLTGDSFLGLTWWPSDFRTGGIPITTTGIQTTTPTTRRHPFTITGIGAGWRRRCRQD